MATAAMAVLLCILLLGGRRETVAEVDVATVGRDTIIETIPSSGRIQPVVEVKISPDVSGEIVELNVREGDRVRRGDLLLKIRQDLYISTVEQAEATLNTLKAQYLQQQAELRRAAADYSRSVNLFENEAMSRADYENSKAQYEMLSEQLKAAEYNVRSGRAALKEARENLTKTVIYAPMEGIVSRLNVEKGERVVGTSQMAGTEMLSIADFSSMEVVVGVSENDIVRIHPRDSASIEVEAYPRRRFAGIVTQIANSAKNFGITFEQVANFEVRIEILEDSYRDLLPQDSIPFRPGMSATVSIVTSCRPDVVTVPLQSVFPDGRTELVWVVDDDSRVHRRAVVTGIQDFGSIEVTEGLEEGERIVTGPYQAVTSTLSEGMKVRSNSQER